MKCICCHKKLAMINCRGCTGTFCSGCILMEAHQCAGIEKMKIASKERLAASLPVVCAPKVQKI
jgi:predicted nucleic acid binding AN1-type Zn finger protein